MVEFHMRKVRTTELGGSPTSLDSPMLFRMNSDSTGFRCLNGPDIYDPIDHGTPVTQVSISSSYDIAF